MSENGRTRWLLWLAGGMLGILIAVITFMGNTIYANDVKYAQERLRIETEARVDRLVMRDIINTQYSEIIQRLTRMESKLR